MLALTYLAYMCYHMTRKPISVVKNVLHRNCSALRMPHEISIKADATNESTWCDYPPFGNLKYFISIYCFIFRLNLFDQLLK